MESGYEWHWLHHFLCQDNSSWCPDYRLYRLYYGWLSHIAVSLASGRQQLFPLIDLWH